MSRTRVSIGLASIASGAKVPTIRYYEAIGLLPAPQRTKSKRRHYDDTDLRRLVFIRRARQLGFEVDAIRTLLAIQDNPDQSCEAVDAIARSRLGEVERRIESLLKLKAELGRMLADCSRGRVAECRIVEVLATPSEGA
jgi:DNA-binding transcriptional MerR regulator